MIQEETVTNAPNQKSTFSTTIIILVVAVVLITSISTWAVLNNVTSEKTSGQVQSNTNVGMVSLNILPSKNNIEGTAKITLNVTK